MAIKKIDSISNKKREAVSRFYEYLSEDKGGDDDWMRESISLSKISIPDRFNKTNPRLFISASLVSQLQSNITPICFAGINPINEFQPSIAPL
jgi:hypothetical protein